MGFLESAIFLAIAGAGATTATATAIAAAATQLIAGLAFSLVGGLVTGALGQTKPSDVRQEAKRISSQPAKRTVYGHTRVPGLRAPGDFVRDEHQYGFYLLQTRPSAGTNITIWLDNRELVLTGDLFDFTGPGATIDLAATSTLAGVTLDFGFVNFWLGLGDQTAPPDQLMTEFGDVTSTDPAKFWPSDAGKGWTILWFRYVRGNIKNAATKWPNYPDIQCDVKMDWSKVWDPRDLAQDPDGPTTWLYNDNQGLCALDAVRTNPVAAYRLDEIRLDDFIEAADVADELRERGDGSFEAAYRVGGMIVWSRQELMDQLQPMARAGAGQFRRVGGRLGYVSGKYYAPSATLTEAMQGRPITVTPKANFRDVPKALRPIYPDPDQSYEDGDLPVVPVEGRGWTPGQDEAEEFVVSMCPYWPQVQRIARIEARRAAAQMTLEATVPPAAIDLLPGATVAVNFTGGGARNREYRVESAAPANFLEDPFGRLAFETPMTLRETSAAIYAHDPLDEEAPIRDGAVADNPPAVNPPENVVASAVTINARDSSVTQITFVFEPPLEGAPDSYSWSYAQDGGAWISGGTIDPDNALSGVLNNAVPGSDYQIRVTAQGLTESEPGLSNVVTAPAGSATGRLVFEQPTAQTEWVITHNFGRRALVGSVIDGDGIVNVPAEAHTDNVTTLTFSEAVAGSVVLS